MGLKGRPYRDKSLLVNQELPDSISLFLQGHPTDTPQIPCLPGGSQACSLASCYYTVFYSLELI